MKDDLVDGLAEDWGGFLGLLSGFSRVGCELCCSRVPRRALVEAIIRWVFTCTGTIGGPSWVVVGLYALHARPVRTALGCCEGYRPGGHGGSHEKNKFNLKRNINKYKNENLLNRVVITPT